MRLEFEAGSLASARGNDDHELQAYVVEQVRKLTEGGQNPTVAVKT